MRSDWSIGRVILGVAAAINILGFGYAAAMGEPAHAAIHVLLALVFGSWAARVRQSAPLAGAAADRLELLEDEVTYLRGELSEAHERIEFTERMMVNQVEHQHMRHDP